MDPTVSALVGIVTGGLLGIMGSVVTFLLTARKEQRQWNRERLLEAYSNAIFYLVAVTNWLYSGADQQAREKSEYHRYLADANQADRWLQLLVIHAGQGRLRHAPGFKELEDFVGQQSFPPDLAKARPWSLNMAYDLLRQVRQLALLDQRLIRG